MSIRSAFAGTRFLAGRALERRKSGVSPPEPPAPPVPRVGFLVDFDVPMARPDIYAEFAAFVADLGLDTRGGVVLHACPEEDEMHPAHDGNAEAAVRGRDGGRDPVEADRDAVRAWLEARTEEPLVEPLGLVGERDPW